MATKEKVVERVNLTRACELLNIKMQYTRKLVKNGKLDAIKEQHPDMNIERWMVSVDSINDYLASPRKGGGRSDGRTKWTIYLNEEEYLKVRAHLDSIKHSKTLLKRANPSKK